MNCSCAICCSRLESSDDIFTTNCGHIFHFPCLTQWLERSKTCPQCREKTSASKIHRLYFNISNNDTIKEDSASLQERIDNLQFQILIRDKDVTDFKAKAAKLQTQMTALRSEVLKLEAEIEHKNSAIHALKEQAKYYKQSHDEARKYKEEVQILRNKLNDFKDVQTLLISTNDEADGLVSCTNDPDKLATYITALKRELTVGLNNRKEYRLMIKQLRQDLNKSILENNTLKDNVKKMRSLEEAMQHLECENKMLVKRLDDNNKSQDCTKSDFDEILESQPVKLPDKKIYSAELMVELAWPRESSEESVECSHNGRYKVQNLVSDNKRKMVRVNSGNTVSSNSILAKKPRLARIPTVFPTKSHDDSYASNGLGGFARIEQFPTASGGVKKKIQSNKSRGVQLNNDTNNQNKIDNFVDLT